MKPNLPLLSAALLLSFIIFSCKKDGKGPAPQNVQDITVTAGYGSATFNWTFPADTAYQYVSISYVDSSGKKVENKYSRYSSSAEIQGLVHRTYDFTVCTVSESGVISQKLDISVTPNDPVYIIVAPTLDIAPGIGAAILKWTNSTGQPLGITISYLDSTGTKQVFSDSSSLAVDSFAVTGLQNVDYSFTVVLSDASGAHGQEYVLTTKPLIESKIKKSDWTITADSEETSGEGPIDGFATAAIDDDISTYWHTEWSNALPGFPHWLAVDMHNEVLLSRVELTPRQGKTDGFTSFDIDTSDDGVNWTGYATGLTLVQNQLTQSFSLPSNPRVRYLRIYATAGVADYTNLAELSIYGSY